MVQITPLLYAISAVYHSSLSSSTSNGNGLAVRQGVNTNDLPPACQASCQVINTLTNCTTTSCECTNSVGTNLEDCMNCLVSNVPSVESDAQTAINSWNQACNGDLKLSGGSGSSSSGSSSSSGGSTSGGAPVTLGTGNIVACIVAILGVASTFLYL